MLEPCPIPTSTKEEIEEILDSRVVGVPETTSMKNTW